MEGQSYDARNQGLTVEARKKEKYEVFLRWLVDNGTVLDPCIQYPVAFGPRGYIGVATSENLGSYRPIIVIPKSLIIDINKVIDTEELKQILIDNPLLFNQSDQQQNNFNMLSLYLVYEKSKGTGSFFKPYFDAAECQDLIVNWTEPELEMIQNQGVVEELRRYKREMVVQAREYVKIIRSNPLVFTSEISDEQYEQYYYWSFEFIVTRVFGWTIPGANLIPFADMLNHGQKALDHCLVNTKQQKAKRKESKPNSISRFEQNILHQKQKKASQVNKSRAGRRLRYIHSHKQFLEDKALSPDNSKQLIHLIAYKQYQTRNKKFRQLYFGSSSCSEDNDTDNSEVMTKAFNKEVLKIDDKQIIKTPHSTKSLSFSLTNYWKVFTQKTTMPLLDQDLEDPLAHLSQNSIQSRSSESEQQEEQDPYTWISDVEPKSVYFVMYTTRDYKKGDQIYNFYGKRANKFLVVGYNFALLENKYDSYGFRLHFDNPAMRAKSGFSVIDHLESSPLKIYKSTEIRVKRNRVSVDLINHCRVLVLSTFQNSDYIYGMPVTIPVSKFIEEKVLELAKQIMDYKLGKFSTTIEEDQSLLGQKDLSYKAQIAVTVRLSYKLILTSQISILNDCLAALRRFQNGRLDLELQDMDKIARIKDYICVLDRSLF